MSSRSVVLACGVLGALALAPVAHADEVGGPPPSEAEPPVDPMPEVREHFARGELGPARDLLIEAYERDPRPAYLFALGQVTYNLGEFDAAIDYYKRFLATNPEAEQAALAHQAIGAARMKIAQPAPEVVPPPVPPRRVRDWDLASTLVVAVGGVTIASGVAMIGYGVRLESDHTGTLSQYDARLDRSLRWQRIGGGVIGGGALIVTAALIRFGVRRVEVAPSRPGPSPGAIGFAVEHRW